MTDPKNISSNFNQCQGKEDEPKFENETPTDNLEGVGPPNNHVLTIENLPPEVLELIFKRVETPRDLLSCWNTTSAFGKPLRSTEFCFKMILPLMMPYLGRKDFLTCSLASKSWRQAVDSCIQDVLHPDLGIDCQSDEENLRLGLTLNVVNMRKFLTKVTRRAPKDTRELLPVANPVAFRRVHFTIFFHERRARPPRNRPLVSYNVEREWLHICLDHHGQFIRQLDLCFVDDNVSYLKIIKLIRKCLKRTPNLRVLKITMGALIVNADVHEEKEKEFNDYISNRPWPPLEHLKMLTFKVTPKELTTMVNAYGPTLNFVKFGNNLMEPNQLIPGRFSCLQKIDYCYTNNTWSGVQLGAFVQSNKCPLKELTVTIGVVPDEGNYVGLTAAANAASATLETLDMHYLGDCPEERNLEITKFEQLQLPKLRKLTLNSFQFPSLEYLKNVCPAVQNLTVTTYFDQGNNDIKNNYISEFGEMHGLLYYQHQFWQELADIRSVDVKCLEFSGDQGEREQMRTREITRKVFTRNEYEAMQKL